MKKCCFLFDFAVFQKQRKRKDANTAKQIKHRMRFLMAYQVK